MFDYRDKLFQQVDDNQGQQVIVHKVGLMHLARIGLGHYGHCRSDTGRASTPYA